MQMSSSGLEENRAMPCNHAESTKEDQPTFLDGPVKREDLYQVMQWKETRPNADKTTFKSHFNYLTPVWS